MELGVCPDAVSMGSPLEATFVFHPPERLSDSLVLLWGHAPLCSCKSHCICHAPTLPLWLTPVNAVVYARFMAKTQSKTQTKTGRNDNRACGKAAKKNPRPNGQGTTGRTIGGYTPAKIAKRAFKRQYGHDALEVSE